MPTTTDIARSHGHTGPIVCEDCGTTNNLHFGSWFDPSNGTSGDFLQCCTCGIKAGDPDWIHDDCAPDEVEESAADDEPQTRIFHRADGWVMDQTPEPCTANHHRQQDGRPPCTDTAVWKVVEERVSADGFPMLTIGFYCDTDLPDQHHHPAA